MSSRGSTRPPSVLAAVSLGSNLGDRASHLDFACAALRSLLTDLVASAYRDTEPVNVDPQPRFLNAAAVGRATLDARELLDRLLAIEQARGRRRPSPGAPRTLDLDLILFGDAMIERPGLSVPHPRFRSRLFVLDPLAEIAPTMRDPVTGLTIAALRDRLAVDGDRHA